MLIPVPGGSAARPGDLPNEAHLPAEQPQASNEARVSRPQGHPWRPSRAPLPPPQGPSQAECVTVPVTRRSTFAALAARGSRYRHGAVRLRALRSDDPDMQPGTDLALAFAFSRSFGCAVDRNRAKRRLRAAFRDAGGPACHGAFIMSGTRQLLDRPYGHVVNDVRSCLEAATASVDLDTVKPVR